MAELLKEVYSPSFIDLLATQFKQAYPRFEKYVFIETIFDTQWQHKELKARLLFIAQTLHQFLPADFQQSTLILKQVAPFFSGYQAMFFPAFIELYGLDNYPISIECLAFLTQFSSAEFAVRPFIVKYPQQMMAQMRSWADSDNFHLRRLASEGCRPRLPWACALPEFKKDPSAILPILEALKDDDQDYVYRSVANNLNDISKDNPQWVINIAQAWLKDNPSKNRRWLVKHGCRGLLKRAHPKALSLFGFYPPKHIKVASLKVDKTVLMGQKLNFSFSLNSPVSLGKCRVEFAMSFMKKRGQQADKIFKISESDIKNNAKQVTKQFDFKAISTRKYYPGIHQLSIIVNGEKMAQQSFLLVG
ncbi:MAG: DNA alkylation repair protein [Psychromonas sp.]